MRAIAPIAASALCLWLGAAGAGEAGAPGAPFVSIDGGTISLDDYAGRPVLIVNTASLCAFTKQYKGLQDLYDTYRDAGLVVLAVPSDDFDQELATGAAVKEFCELNYGIDLPMTDVTVVTGEDAHPVYAWLRETAGFAPRWNFNKVLLDGEGEVAATWPSAVDPMSPEVRGAVERLLD
jgi:glutathione peroxidase